MKSRICQATQKSETVDVVEQKWRIPLIGTIISLFWSSERLKNFIPIHLVKHPCDKITNDMKAALKGSRDISEPTGDIEKY